MQCVAPICNFLVVKINRLETMGKAVTNLANEPEIIRDMIDEQSDEVGQINPGNIFTGNAARIIIKYTFFQTGC